MWHKRRTVIAGAIAVILTVASGPAFAAWPEKTVTVVVPYAAGGNTDIMARLATEWLSNRLGQRFIVENRVGAGATLGTAYVAKADPDGYTVLFGAAPQLLVAPLVQKVTYDARKDFAPVASSAPVRRCSASAQMCRPKIFASSSPTPRPIQAKSTTRAAELVRRATSPVRCSRRGAASTWSTSPTRAACRP